MADNVTISRQKPDKPDLDFSGLREEGIRHIREMASRIWTDHNTHDPGITILETLCYAITDLGYRCSFPVEDLLASDPDNRTGSSPDFFAPHLALPNRPLTINDFRKILIDTPGIRNAWLEIADESEQNVFYDPVSIGLTYNPTAEPIDIRGLYKVRIEFEDHPELGDLNSNIISASILISESFFNLEFSLPYPDQSLKRWGKPVEVQEIKVTLSKSNQQAFDYVAHAKVLLTGDTKAEQFDIKIRIREDKTLWSPHKALLEEKIKQMVLDNTGQGIFGLFHQKMLLVAERLESARQVLHNKRNLCEDYLKIEPVRIQEIAVEGEIEVTLDADAEEVLAGILFDIHRFIDPPIRFFTLPEMLELHSPEEIFDGPLLVHGFIEDQNLHPFNDRGAIYTSDLVQILMSTAEQKIIAVKGLRLGNFIDNVQLTDDALNCLNLFQPELYKPELSVWKSSIKVRKRDITVEVDMAMVAEKYEALVAASEPLKTVSAWVEMDEPFGKDRHTGDYFSIQEQLPLTYGISSAGLSDEAGQERKALARQLKGYLVFYDQLLANFLSQVSNLKNIFSIDPGVGKSYFEQAVYAVPDAMVVLKDFAGVQPSMEDKAALEAAWQLFIANNANSYRTSLEGMMEDQATFLSRRNRFLDHLMARFCEDFTDYSLLMFAASQQQVPEELITDKINFLQELPAMGSERSSALILEGPDAVAWDTILVSGLEKRVARMLGFQDYSRRFLTGGNYEAVVFYQEADDDGLDEYRFRIVDENGQILLSSHKKYKVFEDGYDVIYKVIESGRLAARYKILPSADAQFYFNLYDSEDNIIARRIDLFPTEPDAEAKRDEVIAFMNSHFEGIEDEPEEGLHILEHILLRPRFNEGTGAKKIKDPLMPVIPDDFGNLIDEGKDPYSFRVTAVFPASITKFRDPNFKDLANRILRLETPAHVMPQVFFLDNIQLSRFEHAWKNWLELRVIPVPEDVNERIAHLQTLSLAMKELISAMQFLPEP